MGERVGDMESENERQTVTDKLEIGRDRMRERGRFRYVDKIVILDRDIERVKKKENKKVTDKETGR